MSFIDKETFFSVPAELVKFNKGFGVDIGSSGAKFVYFTKEDIELTNTSSSATAQIRTITLHRSELMEGLKFIKQRAFLFTDRTDEQSSEDVIFTGIGCTQLEKTITQVLNVKFKVKHESDSAAVAFHYLVGKLSRRHLLEPRNQEAVTDALNYTISMAQILTSTLKSDQTSATVPKLDPQEFHLALQQNTGHPVTSDGDDDAASDVSLLEAEPGLYPFLMVFCGSFIFSLKCAAPNEFSYGDMQTSGGRMMLGIANKLIGCKTYSELIDLASRGDSSNVNESAGEAFYSEDNSGNDNLYKSFENSRSSFMKETLYSFGKLVGADCSKFRDEDIASALVEQCVQDFVRSVFLFSLVQGVKRVFLCGGILTHPYVRRLVVVEMVKKNLSNFMIAQTEPVVFDIVKFPQELTALGCLLFHQQQQKQSEAEQKNASGLTNDQNA